MLVGIRPRLHVANRDHDVVLYPEGAGEPVPVDIEIWPTSIVFHAGHRLVLEVGSHDDEGTIVQHSDPRDRM